MKPLVLMLSNYPIKDPRHGGQLRLANIAKAYSEIGMQVVNMAVYEPGAYASDVLGPLDMPLPIQSPYRTQYGEGAALISDILAGEYIASDSGGFNEAYSRLPEHIDVIHSEQPWLWAFAKRIKETEKYKSALTVYGSQNIEAPLRRDILVKYDVEFAEHIFYKVESLEIQATSEADIVAAVTLSDLNVLSRWGAKKLVLATNGISSWIAKKDMLERWKMRLPDAPWLLYIASAHPPNFTGFAECIGYSLGCIPPNSKLVVAGGVSQHIQEQLNNTRWKSLNLSRLQLLFSLPEEDLAAVKTLAHAYLLPIPDGGGSNIKTAEAIYSGAYVVGTETAFRGFEEFVSLPEIVVTKTPAQMQAAVRDVLTKKKPASANMTGMNLRKKLLWGNCLSSLSNAVASLLKNSRDE